jgi:hypothetical protein
MLLPAVACHKPCFVCPACPTTRLPACLQELVGAAIEEAESTRELLQKVTAVDSGAGSGVSAFCRLRGFCGRCLL